MNSSGDTLYATGLGGTHIVPITNNPSLDQTGYQNAILPRKPLEPISTPKVVTTTTTTTQPTLVSGGYNKFLINQPDEVGAPSRPVLPDGLPLLIANKPSTTIDCINPTESYTGAGVGHGSTPLTTSGHDNVITQEP